MPRASLHQDRVAVLSFYVVVLLIGYLVFQLFQPFLTPLGWATVLVVFCWPWHARLEQRIGSTRAAAVSTLVVTLVLIVPGLLLMQAFVEEASRALDAINRALADGRIGWVTRSWDWVSHRVLGRTPVDLAALAKDVSGRVATFVAGQAGNVLRNVALFFFELFVTLFAVFFLFRDAGAIMRGIRRALPFDATHRERMITETRDLISASVTSGLIVAMVQGFLGGVTFALLGIEAPVFWGVTMAFFSLLPVFGAWAVWLPAALALLMSGDVVRGVTLIAIGVGIVGMVDNVLRPMLLSERSQLNGLLVFISLLGGVTVFGFLGLVLGPIVMATAIGLLDAYTKSD